ncbi:capsular polysaccharide biosynthesis protein [Halocynthiibacter namhaensis]|uniref:capsular polysaccharide biosynthesis protein n=1 Tax=Halocynthiibacter namhaensis TaxID=1290553 RepID=UPI0005795210|nr:capsular polysaccharide biosynthesis protein [Halocynthiibacter namhaensis]
MTKQSNGLQDAGPEKGQRLYVYNGGFLTQPRIRRMLTLAGYEIKIGTPSAGDMVGVWGKSPTSPRGEKVADRHDAPILRVEDAFLRSVLPGRSGSEPIGLLLDDKAVHFDSSTPSRLEEILTQTPLDDTAILNRARGAIERIHKAHLSKYNNFDPAHDLPEAGYVLVLDQTRGDASVTYSGANSNTFREMLVFAQQEHPHAKILIKTHPETAAGHREGYFTPSDENDRVTLFTGPVSPYGLMQGAIAVYTVSSTLGFEAIFAGHKPRVFGQPFYAGWGLTQDEHPVDRRQRVLTRAQLFAGAMILYPTWYDPCNDRLCSLEDAIGALEAEVRQWREDRQGYIAMAMRSWKRGHLQKFFGHQRAVRFDDRPKRAAANARHDRRHLMIWAGYADDRIRDAAKHTTLRRVEDGFLRSRGLGANLTPPLSLVADDVGIYYDPRTPSRLEHLIAERQRLSDAEDTRIERLIHKITDARLSKYNLKPDAITLPPRAEGRKCILVPGQVEDDASIRFGTDAISSNAGLLQATREANPDAQILYKPHPDCEVGLRTGGLDQSEALQWADYVIDNADPAVLLDHCDEVSTMTSLMGFEALLRGNKVTCYGVPFYAGWGLTQDMSETPKRRHARPTVAGLAYAALIDYPRYFDPKSGRASPAETIVERLISGDFPAPSRYNRILSKLQGRLASYRWIWTR